MGGVIFDQNTEEAFRRFRSLGIDTDYYMGVYGQRDFFLDLETGRIDADTFCQRVGEVVGHAVSREQARDCWLGFFDGVPVERLDDLVALRGSYRLGLLSNTNPFMMEFMRSGLSPIAKSPSLTISTSSSSATRCGSASPMRRSSVRCCSAKGPRPRSVSLLTIVARIRMRPRRWVSRC